MTVIINGTNTPTAGGVTYGNGTEYATTAAGTSGYPLLSAGSSAPTFSKLNVANVSATGTPSSSTYLRGDGTWSTPTSGALVLLQTVTASSSATVSLETTFDSTYNTYIVIYSNVGITSGAGDLYVRLKVGGSYLSTAVYRNRYVNQSYANTTFTVTNDTTSTGIYLTGYGFTTAPAGGQMTFFGPNTNTGGGGFIHESVNTTPSCVGCGFASTTTAGTLTGVQFYNPAANNITTGTFSLYGVAK